MELTPERLYNKRKQDLESFSKIIYSKLEAELLENNTSKNEIMINTENDISLYESFFKLINLKYASTEIKLELQKKDWCVEKFEFYWKDQNLFLHYNIKTKKEIKEYLNSSNIMHCDNCQIGLDNFLYFTNDYILCPDCYQDSYCCECYEFCESTNRNHMCVTCEEDLH